MTPPGPTTPGDYFNYRKEMKMHPNEPTLEELKTIREELKKSTESKEKEKKLHAIDLQIKRHEEVGQ